MVCLFLTKHKESIMKKTFCILLTLCAIFCLFSCENIAFEEDFPHFVKPVLTEIEGARIPFKTLQVCYAQSGAENRMLVWYTQEEARDGLEQLWLSQEEKDVLLGKNFEVYALVAVIRSQTSSSDNTGQLTEVVQGENVTMVYISEQPDPNTFTADMIVPATVILIQKEDIARWERGDDLSVQHVRARYNTCYPERGVQYF